MPVRGRRWVIVGVAFAAAVAACTSVDPSATPLPGEESETRADDDGAIDDEAAHETLPPLSGSISPVATPPTTDPGPPVIPSEASAAVLRQERIYAQPEPLGPLSLAHGVPPVLLAPGEHTTDVLGIELTLYLDDWWRLDRERFGAIALTRPGTALGGQLPVILFERPVGLVEPNRVADENLLNGEFARSPDDLGAWLDEVAGIEVLATGDAVAGDRTGTWYEVSVAGDHRPALPCGTGPCLHTWWSGASHSIVARSNESLRYYEFPDPAGPIYVVVAAAHDEYDEWVANADAMIRAATFGPSAPHPAPDGVSVGGSRGHAEGEEWRFAAFPGLSITATTRSVSHQLQGRLSFEPWGPGAGQAPPSIVRPFADADGNRLGTLDEVIAALAASPLERLDDETVFDGTAAATTAAVFRGVADGPILRMGEVAPGDRPDFVEWPGRDVVHLWAFDSPLGPLLISVETESESRLASGINRAQALMDALRFDCADGGCDVDPPG